MSFLDRVNALSGVAKLGAAVARANRSGRGRKFAHQIDIVVDPKGVADLTHLLGQLKPRVVRRVLKQAVEAAGRIVAKEAKQLAPVETGLLKKSIGIKAKQYPSGAAVAVVGPRRGFGKDVVRNGHTVYSDPVKYAHLVELGHVIRTRKKGPVLGFVPPKPFLRPAWLQSKARAHNKLRTILQAGIHREAAKKK
jgi:HK97 gp10 family phage protein